MKTFVFAFLFAGLISSASFAQAWRPKPTQRTTTTTTTRVYTRPSQTRIYTTTPSTRVVRVRRARTTGVANARAHGGVAHAYGHAKHTTRIVKVHRER